MRVASLALCLVLAAAVRAEIRPSFHLERSAWPATHVVVATEGETIDGKLTVLESWKGDLAPDAELVLPELAAFASEESRRLEKTFWSRSEPPPFVTGARMILFLERKDGRWSGAGDQPLDVSAVWVEEGRPYAFVQIMNPGDAVLVQLADSEGAFAERFQAIDATHRALDAALALEAPAARAAALEGFTAVEVLYASAPAFDGLRACGSAAVPVLQRMLADESRSHAHGKVIETLAAIGGSVAREELIHVVAEAHRFFRANAPRLRRGWWNDVDDPRNRELRDRYSHLHAALHALQKVDVADAHPIAELCKFWPAVPPPGKDGRSQVAEVCRHWER
ncbi:MAG TPA: hypothetical protein VF618_26010 [Thermoanaerobaculia bacterium]